MTRRTNARLAGIAFLVYIAAAFSGMVLGRAARAGDGPSARLATLAAHLPQARLGLLLEMVGCFCALVLAVTLYAITRDEDADLARLGAVCRIAEGITGAVALDSAAGRLWLAAHAASLDPATRTTLAATQFGMREGLGIGATCFAVGSTIFAWLMLRGRIVPAWLAGLGVAASILVAVLLPLQSIGVVGSPATDLMWLPMLAFELTLAFWFIVKGAASPARRPS
jgi:hypothetical protein